MCNNVGAMRVISCYSVSLVVVLSAATWAQQAAQPQPPTASQNKPNDALELVKQGQKLVSDGKLDEGMALYERASQLDPKAYQPHVAMGAALDLQGKYQQAREHIAKGIELGTGEVQPLRVMAVSYAFECDTDKAAESSDALSTFNLLRTNIRMQQARRMSWHAFIWNARTMTTPSSGTRRGT